MNSPEHIRATTFHGRHGKVRHSLRHTVDYVLIGEGSAPWPRLFSRNRNNLASVHDRDHGGPVCGGAGFGWAREVLRERGVPRPDLVELQLLTQPRYLGYGFNPVSFWLAWDRCDLIAVIAEVNNTFGDRHSYFCANPDFTPITGQDQMTSAKVMHVSPFQDVAGRYTFRFNILADAIDIRIGMQNGNEALVATLTGARSPLTNRALLTGALRRPFGPLRVTALIYWHALRLKLKGAPYRTRPAAPDTEVS